MNQSILPTEQDVAFFEEQGYWIAPKIFDDERLKLFIEHQDRVLNGEYETGREPWRRYWNPGDNPNVIRKIDNSHWSDNVLKSIFTDSPIGEIAAKLLRKDSIRLWHDQLLYKPGSLEGKSSANIGWHQDYAYWQCAAEPTLVTAWVAFTDVDLSNGCMQVVPGSNKWGLMNFRGDFFDQDLEKAVALMDIPEGEKFTTVPLVMKAGQVSFHHALTLHGSGPNTTRHPRRSMAVHLMSGDTRYKAGTSCDGRMHVKLLGGKDGDLFESEYFPILYPKGAKQSV